MPKVEEKVEKMEAWEGGRTIKEDSIAGLDDGDGAAGVGATIGNDTPAGDLNSQSVN